MHKLPGSAVCTWCSSVQSGGESSTQLTGVSSCEEPRVLVVEVASRCVGEVDSENTDWWL